MKKSVLMLLGHDMEKPILDPRVFKEAKSLDSLGIPVTILCFSDHATESSVANAKVRRVKRPFGAKKLLKKRPFLALALLLLELPFSYLMSLIGALKENPTHVHCHDIDTLPIGVAVKVLRPNVVLVYDSHELATGMPFPPTLLLLVRFVEGLMLPMVDILITANKSRLKIMEQIYKRTLLSKKKEVFENYPEPLTGKPVPAEFDPKVLGGKVSFLYQGPLDSNRGIRELLQGMTSLSQDNWFLLIVGGNPEQIAALKAEFPHKNIHFTGFVRNTEVPRYQALADVGIVALLNTCKNNYYCSPNKLYEYMQTGCAILGPDFEDIAHFIISNGLGVVTDFSDPNKIATSVRSLIENKEALGEMKRKSITMADEFIWAKNQPAVERIYAV